jgi:hypothetical protein
MDSSAAMPSSMEEEKYSEEVIEWMRVIQLKLSSAYQFICHIFNEIQLIFKALYSLSHTSHSSPSLLLSSSSLPSSLSSLGKALEDVEMLLQEILPLKISYSLIARNLIEECLAWNEDVSYCTDVLKTIQTLLIAIHNQLSSSSSSSAPPNAPAPPAVATSVSIGLPLLQTLGDALSDIVTSLQIGEDGQPLEFVAWKAGSVVCNVITTGLLRGYPAVTHLASSTMNISSFSPINKGQFYSPLLLSPLHSSLLSCLSGYHRT